MLDGATHNNPYDNLNLPLPFPDALQEFRAETSALTAQNGMHSGAAVNAVTKSGTNQIRGDAFEFFRDHSMNATDPFAAKNADGTRKDDGLVRNQYGATLGGPIRTDKMFFFFGYQGTDTRVNPTDNQEFVPTAAMLAGDFTAYASAACNGGKAVTSRRRSSDNRIDPSLLSPAALKHLEQASADHGSACGLIRFGQPSATDDGQGVGKVDYQLSDKHSMFGRYIGPQSCIAAALQPARRTAGPAGDTRWVDRNNLAQMFTVGENFVISSDDVERRPVRLQPHAIHRTSTDFSRRPRSASTSTATCRTTCC